MAAQSQEEYAKLMSERGEYYFSIRVSDPNEVQSINRLCSVDGTDGETVVCYANGNQYEAMLRAGYQPTLMTPPSLRQEATMWKGGDRASYAWDSYLTYEQYVSMMQSFPSSAISGRSCTLLDLGTLSTANHRKILGVRLNNGQADGKPKFLYTSTMHGDEVTGMILMLRLIDELCTSTDTRIVNLLDSLDIFIFPLTNPDGTYNGGNSTVTGARRYNGNNIDLNRHFPDFDDGAHPDGETTYQDEAQWMMDLAQEHLFTMAANYHGGAEVLNYPWDTYQPVHPDDAWWQYICLKYADAAHAVNSSYMTGTSSNGIINGYAWYTITGSRQDYMNYYGQCREVTIECSNTKTPSASLLPNFWNYNHEGMLLYMEECLNGVHGLVYDAQTKAPLEGVSVSVQGHDHHGSQVSTHAVGDFHRPIKGGTYTFVFSKSGYSSQSVEVTIADDQRVDLAPIYMEAGEDPAPTSFNMQDGSLTTCDATFYDAGGPDANYDSDLDYTLTLYPSSEGASLLVSFTTFNLENNYDKLYIYDGTSTSATLIGTYTGTTSPGTVTATNDQGALTFRFTSDYSVNRDGWIANVSCSYPEPEPITPHWTPNTDTYADNMTMNAIIQIDGEEQFVNTLEVGVFVGDECRGSALPMLFPFNNRYILNLVIAGQAGESFTFRLYDHDAETELTPALNAPSPITFDQDGYGSPINPLVLNFTTGSSPSTQAITFKEGWNWFSSYITYEDHSLNDIQSQITAAGSTSSMIKSQDQFTNNTNGTWSGSITSLNNMAMYLVLMDREVTITIEGSPIDPSSLPISIKQGWNWISYPLDHVTDLETALSGINPSENDIIKSQNASATFVNGAWSGTLSRLEPGQGYLYLSNASQAIQLIFQE